MRSPDGVRFLHVPRTGGTSLRLAWRLRPPEYLGHALPEGERFAYGFTRNPWDRAVSVYHLLHPNEPAEGRVSFREWVLDGMRAASWEGIPVNAPCSLWLRRAQFVGRFEDRRDVELLASMLARPVPMEHHGATERGPYAEYYDERSARLVGAFYAEDVERYGYTFEGAV